MGIRIELADWSDKQYFYIFESLLGRFWPDGSTKWRDNHDAQKLVIAKLVEQGCEARSDEYGPVKTPEGVIRFDSEAGHFNAFSDTKTPLYRVIEAIDAVQAERDKLREVLR